MQIWCLLADNTILDSSYEQETKHASETGWLKAQKKIHIIVGFIRTLCDKRRAEWTSHECIKLF